MNYIITGATSMLGISVCEYLSLAGHTVYAVCRQSSANLMKIPQNEHVHLVYSDLEHIATIVSEFPAADVFINFAWGNTDHQGRDSEALQNENVGNTLNCISTACQLGCKLFVEAGSQAEYGYVSTLITEETPCNPETAYGKAKLKVHDEGAARCKELGMKYLHLRIFSVFGENDRHWTLIMTAIKKMRANEDMLLSSCAQSWNYLYAKDCAKQICLLCEYGMASDNFISEVFHIASEDTRTLRSYVEEIKQVLHSSSQLLFGEMKSIHQVSLNPSVVKTKKAINFISDYSFADSIKLINDKI